MFHCNCDSFWLQDWINNHDLDICKPNSSITCSTERGYISLSQLSEETLSCVVTNSVTMTMAVSFAILSSMLMIMFFLVYCFRYELFYLHRKFHGNKKMNEYSMKGNRIYVSIDENAPGVIPWVIHELEPRLLQAGYFVFLPCRDVEP